LKQFTVRIQIKFKQFVIFRIQSNPNAFQCSSLVSDGISIHANCAFTKH